MTKKKIKQTKIDEYFTEMAYNMMTFLTISAIKADRLWDHLWDICSLLKRFK